MPPPLTERELHVVRAMIDEYEASFARRQLFRGWLGGFRLFLAVVGAVLLIVLNVVTIVILLGGVHH